MSSKLIPGKNDLATLYPDLAAEWSFTINADKQPDQFLPFSMKRVWWVCKEGHEYEMCIANRTAQGQGCPYCAGKRALAGFNDLLSLFPEIAAGWDYQKNEKGPEQYTAHSNKKVFWICEKGHFFSAAIYDRTREDGKRTGCPYCSGRLALTGENDLATLRPDLASEWDKEKNGSLLPSQVTEFSMKEAFWICNKGHSWKTRIAYRSAGNNCPYCSNKKVLPGFNDLSTLFPDVAKEWNWEKNAGRPEDCIPGTHREVWWRCSRCGNEWRAQIKERTYGKTGCPKCTFYHKTSFPEQAVYYYVKRAFPDAINSYRPEFLEPYEIDVFIPSLRVGIEYDGFFWHQDRKADFEKTKKLIKNGIQLIRISEVKREKNTSEHDIVIPSEFNRRGNASLEGAIVELFAVLNEKWHVGEKLDINLDRDESSIREISAGAMKKTSLASTASPEILAEWNWEKNGSLTPEMVSAHSHYKVWWRCSKCGREYQQYVNTKKRTGCEHCNKTEANIVRANKAIARGQAKSVADFPLLLKEWDWEENGELDPKTVTYGSMRKVSWICSTCGNKFQMAVKNRTGQGQGCPLCGIKKSAATRAKMARKSLS